MKINFKNTQDSSELTAYRPNKVKVQGRKGKKQQVFHDSGSGLDTLGKKKMEEDGAVLVPEVPDDLDLIDFSGNPVEIIGYTIYMIDPLGTDNYKPKKFFVAPAVEDDKLLVGLETMKAWGVVNQDFPKPNINAFLHSKETMDSVKLWIAVIEKSLKTSDNPEEKTNQTKECNMSQPEIPDVTSENNDDKGKVSDTNNCTQVNKSENKEVTQEITVPQTDNTTPKTSERVTQATQ